MIPMSRRAIDDFPSGNTGGEVLAKKKVRNDIHMTEIGRKGNLMMQRSPIEGIAEVPKQILQIGEDQALRDEEDDEEKAEAHTSHGNDKEAEVEVPVIAGVEVVVKVQRGRTKLLPVCETGIKKEKGTTMNDQIDQEQMKEKKNTRNLHHASVTAKVKKHYNDCFPIFLYRQSFNLYCETLLLIHLQITLKNIAYLRAVVMTGVEEDMTIWIEITRRILDCMTRWRF